MDDKCNLHTCTCLQWQDVKGSNHVLNVMMLCKNYRNKVTVTRNKLTVDTCKCTLHDNNKSSAVSV